MTSTFSKSPLNWKSLDVMDLDAKRSVSDCLIYLLHLMCFEVDGVTWLKSVYTEPFLFNWSASNVNIIISDYFTAFNTDQYNKKGSVSSFTMYHDRYCVAQDGLIQMLVPANGQICFIVKIVVYRKLNWLNLI